LKPIFISYSSKHRELTRELAAVIEAQYGPGSVWWDDALESRGSYAEQIKAALEQARVVVVIWTSGAVISDYVYAEAHYAQTHGKLVNVRPRDMSFRDIPEPFNIHHIDDIEDHARILRTIAKVMVGTPIPTRVPLHEIYYRQHGHRLIDPKQSQLARDPREVSPTQLLQAKFAVVGYRDVTGLRTDLIGWCAATGSRTTAGRVIHGPGGLGKTRLMIEVTTALRERGWTAGFLDRAHEQVDTTLRQRWQALDQLIAHSEDAGLLIVLDYAEGRQDEVKRIAERISRRSEVDTRPIRLVLLARGVGAWWTTLHDDTPEVQTLFRGASIHPDVMALPPASSGQQRLDLFQASLDALEPRLAAQGYRLPSGMPSPQRLGRIESGIGYARPLAIQMEALLWLASASPEAGVIGVEALLRPVLGLERSHWRKLIGALDDERARDMARGVAQVTLVHGTPSRAATERLLMADAFYGGQRTARVAVDPVVGDLSLVYGSPEGGVGHLEPDLIGEHHVATVGDIELIDGCVRWIGAELAEARGQRQRYLLTMLQRATQPEHGATANDRAIALLDHLVSTLAQPLAVEMVAVMVDTSGALVDRLDRQVDTLDEQSLDAIDAALPIHSLSLMDVSLRVALRRAHLARQRLATEEVDASDPDMGRLNHLAACIRTLSLRLFAVGRREEALAASQEAVELYRRLAQTRPDAFLPDLASSVGSLGPHFSALGRREEALAASQEAVELYRRLAQARPDAFLPDLGMSLSNLGNCFSALGRREEALGASQEAVELYRCLAQPRPDAFLPDLGMSLNNLGHRFSALGRQEEALAASQEAVDIRRRLAQVRPDAFLPDLAGSVNNLGNRFSALGRREEALAASQEAVELCRRLAQARPDAFLPDLGMSLNNLGNCCSALGRQEEALAASQEAVDIRRRLAQVRPDAFLPDLAGSVNNLSNRFSALGRREEALAASQEAVELYRRLAQARPDAFLPDLGMSLNNLGHRFSALGRWEEALAASQEAVELYRGLAQTRPDAFLPGLAGSVNNLSNRCSALGRREEALAASQEAVELYRRLAQARPDAFLPDLARSIGILSDVLAQLDRRAEATQAAHEALELLVPVVERYPGAYRTLARTIAAQVVRLSEAVAQKPNGALLQRVAQALEMGGATAGDAPS
jgi:tetratricopeptide (TPR) repeat protein